MTVSLRPDLGPDASLMDLLHQRARTRPDHAAYIALDDDGPGSTTLAFGALEQRARDVAASLDGLLAPGDRALLLYPPGLDYVIAFLGCLYAGVVAVPAYPPDPARLQRTLPRLTAMMDDADARVVLTTQSLAAMAGALGAIAPGLATRTWHATDTVSAAPASWRPPPIDARTTAFLQYTSGSTSEPKGVVLSHGNVLTNLASIADAFGMDDDSSGVIWLPPYHDMGLIGGILGTLYGGFTTVLMSPLAFLRRPMRWLETLSTYGATISGGPNFAYDLCVSKSTAAERARLDLRRWKLAFSGAEPVRPETIDRFTDAFSPAGFQRESFYPCYGLAESTLIVSGGRAGDAVRVRSFQRAELDRGEAIESPASESARSLVGCGTARPGHEIAIVDASSGRSCPPGRVGEIFVRGPSVASGYWNRPALDGDTFDARRDGGSRGYLRTGDLGFVLDGELFVTGRIKEVMIVRGRNVYPQDVERTVEASGPGLRRGCGAAFAVQREGEERVVVVQEVDPRVPLDLTRAAAAVRRSVAAGHELALESIVFVPPGTVPKTSSGKIQRGECRRSYEEGRLPALAESRLDATQDAALAPPMGPTETAVTEIFAEVLGRTAVGRDEHFFEIGGDSLHATQVVTRLRERLGVEVPLRVLFEQARPCEIALVVDATARSPVAADTMPAIAPAPRDRPLPLSVTQDAFWFLDQLHPRSLFFNTTAGFWIDGPFDPAAFARAVNAMIRRHEVLRTSLRAVDGVPQQVVSPELVVEIPVVDLRGGSPADGESTVRRMLADFAATPLDLAQGPLLRASIVRLADTRHALVVVIHHVLIDDWSYRVIAREVAMLYAADVSGSPPQLPEVRVQYADFAHWQKSWMQGDVLASRIAFWQKQLQGASAASDPRGNRPRSERPSYRAAAASFVLPSALSQAVTDLARREHVTLFMPLLAAFQIQLARASGCDDVAVVTPVANRLQRATEDMIGCVAHTVVLRTRLAGNPSHREVLARVRATCLDAYAHQDAPFKSVVDAMKPGWDLYMDPPAKFIFENTPLPALQDYRIAGLTLAPIAMEPNFQLKNKLLLVIERDPAGLRGILYYNTDDFDHPAVLAMVEDYQAILTDIAFRPDAAMTRHT